MRFLNLINNKLKYALILGLAFALQGCGQGESLVDGSDNVGPIEFPVDFELSAASYATLEGFNGGFASIISNPQTTGNSSDQVVEYIKNGQESYGGFFFLLPEDIDFSQGTTFTVDVWSSQSRNVLLKIESETGSIADLEVSHSGGSSWETLTFDLSSLVKESTSDAVKIVVIIDNGTVGAGGTDWTFYIDNIVQTSVEQPLTLTVAASSATDVKLTGPFWGWDPAGGPTAQDNGDGTWTVTLDPVPTADMEYLWVVDGVQENITDNSPQDYSCTPVTDNSTYANRQWTVGSGNVTDDIYDSCIQPLNLTVQASGANSVRITGPFWGWDPSGGPTATDNNDGTWTVTLDPAPSADMEYLWVVDGIQENITDNTPQDYSCTPVTDNSTYANRQWTVGSPDVEDDIYDSCTSPLTLTVSVSSASDVRITGPFWGWDPAGGPAASDNSDGTWTVTLDPPPSADMEYLWVVDSVQENITDNTPQDYSCTPVTDNATYANRQWTVGSANVTDDIYDSCQ